MVLRIISEHKYICGRAKEESRKGYNETLSFTYINSLGHFSSQFLHHHDHTCFFFSFSMANWGATHLIAFDGLG